MVWSSKLAIFYPYRDFAIVSRPILAALFLVLTITALTVWQIKKRPYLAWDGSGIWARLFRRLD